MGVNDIVGIEFGDCRHSSCEEHVAFCGVVLAPDVIVNLKEEIFMEGEIESIVSAYWVMDSL